MVRPPRSPMLARVFPAGLRRARMVLWAVSTATIVWLVRNATRRLAIGLYVMLVCALVTPAPIVWGDDHLGFAPSQAVAGYGCCSGLWARSRPWNGLVGAITRRLALGLTFGICVVAIMLGVCWVVSSGGPALGLALSSGVGTVAVLALGWLAHRHAAVASALDWRSAATAGATCVAVAACVYLPGPRNSSTPGRAAWISRLWQCWRRCRLSCSPVCGRSTLRHDHPSARAKLLKRQRDQLLACALRWS